MTRLGSGGEVPLRAMNMRNQQAKYLTSLRPSNQFPKTRTRKVPGKGRVAAEALARVIILLQGVRGGNQRQ